MYGNHLVYTQRDYFNIRPEVNDTIKRTQNTAFRYVSPAHKFPSITTFKVEYDICNQDQMKESKKTEQEASLLTMVFLSRTFQFRIIMMDMVYFH